MEKKVILKIKYKDDEFEEFINWLSECPLPKGRVTQE